MLRPDRAYIVSAGSVGQPRDYDNRASIFDARLGRNLGPRLFITV